MCDFQIFRVAQSHKNVKPSSIMKTHTNVIINKRENI